MKKVLKRTGLAKSRQIGEVIHERILKDYEIRKNQKTEPVKGPNMRTKELLEEGLADVEIIKKILEEFPSFDSEGYTNKNGVYVKSGEEKVKEFIQYWREKESKSNEDDGR